MNTSPRGTDVNGVLVLPVLITKLLCLDRCKVHSKPERTTEFAHRYTHALNEALELNQIQDSCCETSKNYYQCTLLIRRHWPTVRGVYLSVEAMMNSHANLHTMLCSAVTHADWNGRKQSAVTNIRDLTERNLSNVTRKNVLGCLN